MAALARLHIGRNVLWLFALGLVMHPSRGLAIVVSDQRAQEIVAYDESQADGPLLAGPDDLSDSNQVTGSDFAPFDAVPCPFEPIPMPACQSCIPAWTVMTDVLFLQRSRPAGYGILFDRTTGEQLFSASQLGTNANAGPRVTVLRRLSDCRLLDVEYFAIDGWSSFANFGPGLYTLTGDRTLSGPGATTASFIDASRLQTVEVNVRTDRGGWFQPLAGFRWLHFGETYQVNGLTDDQAPTIGPYFLHYKTCNQLYGLQIGGNGILWNRGPVTISSLAKAGIFLNDATNAAGFSELGTARPDTFTRERRAALVGEVGLTLTWQWSDRLSFRGGYQLYWLDGIALAPDQVLSTSIGSGLGGINTTHGLVLQGSFAGLQFTW